MLERTHWKVDLTSDSIDLKNPNVGSLVPPGSDEANCIGSQIVSDGLRLHAPALDLDVPHSYVESSTPGHGHLLIDVPMTWEQYKLLMVVLVEVGIIERGYMLGTLARGGSYLRLPHVKKGDPAPDEIPF